MTHHSRAIGDQLLGSVIAGAYRIDAELGSSAMATAYRATRLHIGDSVAIKVLRPELSREPQFVARFRREVQAVAHLKHPNVTPIYDFGVAEGGAIYVVTELVEGQNLDTIIKETGPIPPRVVAEIVRQVCSALSEARRQQIVHGDLKPANVAVESTPDGPHVKVLDFGIAALRTGDAATDLTQAGVAAGTPAYMSPEQCLGEELDERSDIYSLGVIVFEMLSGVVPFNSPTPAAVAVQHVQQAPPPLRVLNAGVPAAVEGAVLRALAKPRESRFQTARDFADALTTAVSGPRLSYGTDTIAAPALSALWHDATQVAGTPVPPPANRSMPKHTAGIVIGVGVVAVVTIAGLFPQRAYGVHPTPKVASHRATTAPSRPRPRRLAVVRSTAQLRTLAVPRSLLPYEPTTYGRSSSASDTVRAYYARLNAQDFSGAYALLSPAFQQQLPFYQWRNGYATTIASNPEIEAGDDPARISLRLIAQDRKDGEIVTTVYAGTWSLIADGRGGWLLDDGRLQVVSRH